MLSVFGFVLHFLLMDAYKEEINFELFLCGPAMTLYKLMVS